MTAYKYFRLIKVKYVIFIFSIFIKQQGSFEAGVLLTGTNVKKIFSLHFLLYECIHFIQNITTSLPKKFGIKWLKSSLNFTKGFSLPTVFCKDGKRQD
jgi:hypothetical protein